MKEAIMKLDSIKKILTKVDEVNNICIENKENLKKAKASQIAAITDKETMLEALNSLIGKICACRNILEYSSASEEKHDVYRFDVISFTKNNRIAVMIDLTNKSITYTWDYDSDSLEVYYGEIIYYDSDCKAAKASTIRYPSNYDSKLEELDISILIDIVKVLTDAVYDYERLTKD